MIEKLKEVLAAEDTVLFIGSGVSRWSGLPSWEGLLHKLADWLETTGRNGSAVKDECSTDLLLAASYGFDQLTSHEIGQFMREACLVGTASPHLIHQKLAALTPRCFITTNYDKLLEDGLRLWRPERPIRVVTNRQQVDVADLFGLRTIDFVFKPHGDIDDSESVILTRENYRNLLDGGKYKHALRALEMLLATRQVVYVGFGLRDLDFLLLRDALANSFKGGVRDHYAIMPDVQHHERGFWRRHYGIHLVSYPVVRSPSGQDHSAVLTLLDKLAAHSSEAPQHSAQSQSDILLKVLRLVSGQMRFTELTPTFPLLVHKARTEQSRQMVQTQDPFSGRPASDFLQTGPKHSILIGLPGSGKTYRLKQAAASLARRVHEHYLGDESANSGISIPLYVDLKFYSGSLISLIESNLPDGLDFALLASKYSIRLFLDSFNEIPREQIECKSHEADIREFVAKFQSVTIVVGSRTNDGLRDLNFQEFMLDEIDRAFVQKFLDEKGIKLETHFEAEMRSVLQRPFYFQLVFSNAIPVRSASRPKDIYEALFRSIDLRFKEKFSQAVDLRSALSLAAYDAMNKGDEAIIAADFRGALTRAGLTVASDSSQSSEILNFLISCDIVIPHSGGRLAFFHQSFTEYLASLELTRRFALEPRYLTEKLVLRRWDQAIFLAVSLLPPTKASDFIKDVIRLDIALAMRAIKYVEEERQYIVDVLLRELFLLVEKTGEANLSYSGFLWEAQRFLDKVSIDRSQKDILDAIGRLGGLIGSAAFARQLDISSDINQTKSDLLAEMRSRRGDYNFCSALGTSLRKYTKANDLPALVSMTDEISNDFAVIKDLSGFGLATGIANILRDLPLSKIADAYLHDFEDKELNAARRVVLCNVVRESLDQAGLDLARQLFNRGIEEATFSLHMITRFSKEQLIWNEPTEIQPLIDALGKNDKSNWGVEVIKWLCDRHASVKAHTESRATHATGVRRVVLFAAIDNQQMMFEALADLLKLTVLQLDAEPIRLVDKLEIKWEGNASLLRDLLQLRHNALAISLIEATESVSNFALGDIQWWLEWMASDQSETGWWLTERLSRFFADFLSVDDQKKFVAEFNRKECKYRPLLEGRILRRNFAFTTDDLTEESITHLLNSEAVSGSILFEGELLGRIATESFVTERLLPLVPNARGKQRDYLVRVLDEAGHRHGRRYLVAEATRSTKSPERAEDDEQGRTNHVAPAADSA